MNDITKIEGVIGCGEHLDVIHVFIDKDGNITGTKKQIKQAVGKFRFSCIEASKIIEPLFSSGSKIIAPTGFATLGCFLQRNSDSSLFAVTAGHVQKFLGKEMRLNNKAFADFEIKWEDGVDADIAIAKVKQEFVEDCDLMLQDEDEVSQRCLLLMPEEYDEKKVSNLVHFKGAASNISRGEIEVMDFKLEGMTEKFIVIKDRKERITKGDATLFCQKGDSGSVVCSIERRGRYLFVLGTVVGEMLGPDTKRYIALLFYSGLQHLNKKHESVFELCEQYKDKL